MKEKHTLPPYKFDSHLYVLSVALVTDPIEKNSSIFWFKASNLCNNLRYIQNIW